MLVAEGEDGHAVRADGDGGGDVVHVGVGDALRGDVPADPGVQDAGAVDAQEDAQAGLLVRMVHMGKGVHAALRVIVDRAVHTVHDAGGAGGGGDFARIEDVQGEGVVGLVAGAVRDRDAGGEAQDLRRFLGEVALLAEGGTDLRDEVRVEAELREQAVGHLVLPEVPEDALGQAADSRADGVRQAHGDVVAREHDLVDALVQGGLVPLHPGEFRGGEVAGIVQQVVQAPVGAQFLEGLVAVGDGAGVAPDDGRAQDVAVLVHAHEAVHLVGIADLLQDVGGGEFQVGPPHGGVLFGEAGLLGHDGRLALRIEGGGHALAGLDAHEAGLDGRTSDVVTKKIHV